MKTLLRLLIILLDLGQGFLIFSRKKNIVTFFGGARFSKDHQYSIVAKETAVTLAKYGFGVMTGGGGGVMISANQGAFEANGRSYACTVKLPYETEKNPYIHKQVKFHHLFTRKMMMMRFAKAYLIFPGGFGTLDELFEILTYLQVTPNTKRPVILVGKSYWEPMYTWMENTLMKEGAITQKDLDLIYRCDSPEEILRILAIV